MENLFFKTIWLLIQMCLTIHETLRHLRWRLQLVSKSYDNNVDCKKINNFYEKCNTELEKLPQHLSIIIGTEEKVEDIVIINLMKHALQLNIGFVSLYDAHDRHFKLHENLNFEDGCAADKLKSNPNMYSNIFPTIDKNCNGFKRYKTEKEIQISKKQFHQEHELVAKVCRDFFQHKKYSADKRTENINFLMQRIDEELCNWYSPELCIVFSKHMSTFGMSPWQMSFTEFYLYDEKNDFDVESFVKILYKYAHCEQRWGK